MGFQCVTGALAKCTFGVAPTSLISLTTSVLATTPAATTTDSAPIVNVPTFGMCSSLANPAVASATTAALGVLTPMPCVPVPAGTWIVGNPQVLIQNKPALNDSSQLICSYGGVITITSAGQFKVMD